MSEPVDIGGGLGYPSFHSECNAFCRPDRGEHAAVCWSVVDAAIWRCPRQFGEWLGMMLGHRHLTILGIEDAPEAPEYGPNGLGPHRRLVRWREPILQVNGDGEWTTVIGVRNIELR